MKIWGNSGHPYTNYPAILQPFFDRHVGENRIENVVGNVQSMEITSFNKLNAFKVTRADITFILHQTIAVKTINRLNYLSNQIVQIIEAPIVLNSRNIMRIPKVEKYWGEA